MKLACNGFVTYDERDGLAQANAVFEDRDGGLCVRGYVLSNSAKQNLVGGSPDAMRSEPEILPSFGRFDGKHFKWFLPDELKPLFGWVGEGVTLQAHNGEWWIGTGNWTI